METKAWQLTNVGYKMASVFYKVRAQNTTDYKVILTQTIIWLTGWLRMTNAGYKMARLYSKMMLVPTTINLY